MDYEPRELIPLWRGLLIGLTGGKVAYIHTRRDIRQRTRLGKFPFFNGLIDVLHDMGYQVTLMPLYRPPWVGWLNRRCLHIYRGPGRTWRGRGVLSVAKGYIDGWWYLDPMGHRDHSSVGARTFRPRRINEEPARELFGRLKRRRVKTGASPRAQVERGAVAVPDGCIAIMLQVIEAGRPPNGAICSEADMVRTVVAARGQRPVVIKFHPFGASKSVRRAVAEVTGPDVQVVEANVHDILEAASMVCTLTSGVGFEALLHQTPTVLFAAADYHHVAIPVKTLADVPRALDEAGSHRAFYARYVYWFLERNLFRPDAPNFDKRVRRVIKAVSQSPRDKSKPPDPS